MAATEAPAAALSNQLLFIQIRDQQTSHMAHGDGCQWCQAVSMVPRYDAYLLILYTVAKECQEILLLEKMYY